MFACRQYWCDMLEKVSPLDAWNGNWFFLKSSICQTQVKHDHSQSPMLEMLCHRLASIN